MCAQAFPGYGGIIRIRTKASLWMNVSSRNLRPGISCRFLQEFRKGGVCAGLPQYCFLFGQNGSRVAFEEWHSLLRGELGFTGCIITAIYPWGPFGKCCDIQAAAIQAIKAGNDLLCCTDYGIQLPAVIEAVRTGEISEERIEESVRRIFGLEARLGLLPEDAVLS